MLGRCRIEEAMRRHVRMTVLLVVALLLAGCGSDGSDGSSTPEGAVPERFRFEPDQDNWSLPLDFLLGAVSLEQRDFATNLLVRDCMVKAGHRDWPQPLEPVEMDIKHFNGAGRRLFDPSIAASQGYHGSPVDRPNSDYLADYTISKHVEADLDGCATGAADRVEELISEIAPIESFAGAAYDAAKADPEVRQAAERWNECMLKVGIPDLPAEPYDMPTETMAARFKLGTDPATGERLTKTPTADEVKVAVGDADCRDSSEFSATFYQAEVSAQARQIESNEGAVERAFEQSKSAATGLQKIVETAGG